MAGIYTACSVSDNSFAALIADENAQRGVFLEAAQKHRPVSPKPLAKARNQNSTSGELIKAAEQIL